MDWIKKHKKKILAAAAIGAAIIGARKMNAALKSERKYSVSPPGGPVGNGKKRRVIRKGGKAAPKRKRKT